MVSISLNMIVKNEAHIINETLENLMKIKFSYWVICDTGSTDDTISIIKEFFKKRNIPGELIQHQWKDFGYNRSLALDCVYNKSDYVLIFDADDLIQGDLDASDLKDDMYKLKIGKDFTYTRPLLVNNRLRWKYIGVLHEYLECSDNYKTESILEGNYYIESRRLGNRSLDKNKYIKDAEVLEKAFSEEKDLGLRDRYAFYCAQSYKDAGYYEKCVEWYKKVLKLNNWSQEKYYSCLMISYYSEDKLFYLNLANNYDHERTEHISEMCKYFDECENHIVVNSLYHKYKNRKTNLKNKLFLRKDEMEIEYYNSISAFYVKDYQSGYDCSIKLLKARKKVNLILKNIHYYSMCYDKNDLIWLFELTNSLILKNSSLTKTWNSLFDKIEYSEKKYIHQNIDKPKIFLSITSCKRLDLFKKTMNSILNNWTDYDMIDYWFCVDDNSSEKDRSEMKEKYPFFDFCYNEGNGHKYSMNIIWDKLNTLKPKYWIHLEDDFVFFDKRSYVKDAIKGLEYLDVQQILFNRCYAETIEDYNISGYIDKGEYCLHEYSNVKENYLNNKYWPHYSLRPSLILTESILALGNYDSENNFFEIDYAKRWFEKGYKSGYFNKITSKHIGKLTKDNKELNAYGLNNKNQF